MSVNELSNGDLTCVKRVTSVADPSDRPPPSGNCWTCQQNNANNAYYVTGSSGEVNNNNKNNTYGVVPVAELDDFSKSLFEAETDCWKTKKNNPEAVCIHYQQTRLYNLLDRIKNNTYEPEPSICFVLEKPVPREVFASQYRDRIIHHLIAPFMCDVLEQFHNSNGNISHGNRKQHSAQTAAEQIQSNMRKFPNGYVMTMDISGFFMTIPRQLSYEKFLGLCKRFAPRDYDDSTITRLLKLLYILITTDPAKNCIRRSPTYKWDSIPSNKIIHANSSIGIPIGNFYSQLIANMLSGLWGEKIKNSHIECYPTVFMDDMCVVVPTKSDCRVLRNLSRDILSSLQLNINTRKMYTQPVRHGVRFCGRFIYTDRIYTINRSIRNLKNSIHKYLNRVNLSNAYKLLSCYNSYTGLMCHTASFNIARKLAHDISNSEYKKWLYFSYQRNKVVCKMYSQYKKEDICRQHINKIHEQQKEYEYTYKRQYRRVRNSKTSKHQ